MSLGPDTMYGPRRRVTALGRPQVSHTPYLIHKAVVHYIPTRHSSGSPVRSAHSWFTAAETAS